MENNRNTIIGVMLISMLVMALFWNQANKAQQEEVQETEEQTSSPVTTNETAPINNNETANINIENDTTTAASIDTATQVLSAEEQQAKAFFGPLYPFASGTEESYVLENELMELTISSKGAQVQKVWLKEFLTFDKEPLHLIDNSQEMAFQFNNAVGNNIKTSDLYYKGELNGNTLTLTADFGNGAFLSHVYTIEEGSYLVDYDVQFNGLAQYIPNKNTYLDIVWDYKALPQEQNIQREKQKSTIYWKETGEDVDHLGIGKSKSETITADADWISYKQQFFNTTLLSKGIFDNSALNSTINNDDSTAIAVYDAKLTVAYDPMANNEYELQYFFGPNDFRLLKKSVGRDMQNIVELSYDFFLFNWVKYINKWVIIPIFNMLEKVISNYGIIILILTLIIKMALMPLTFKSYVSTAKQKLLKPELDKLKEKYPDDQQKFASEQMKLYQKTGVSMFGGCLPTLLQMPILLAMFYFFPSSIELRQESFLWAQDLSTFDTVPFLTWSANIPILGNHLSPFTLLMTLSSLLMARFNTQMQSQQTQPGMEMMKYMPYIFPFFLLFLFNTWPAALTYYYFLSNMITFGQQFVIKRFFIDEEKLKAQLEANKKKPVKKKGGFAAKLEEMYKQQQQVQQQQKKKSKK